MVESADIGIFVKMVIKLGWQVQFNPVSVTVHGTYRGACHMTWDFFDDQGPAKVLTYLLTRLDQPMED